ncbi:MAG: right-handed parallel beta-helix repeat-containing protein [Patescibacteria group bacterium]
MTEILHAPIHLAAGDVLEGREFLLSPDFQCDPGFAAITAAPRAALRHVTLDSGYRTRPARWGVWPEPTPLAPGLPAQMVGIRADRAAELTIEDVAIRGMPAAGIDSGGGIHGAVLRKVRVRDCGKALIVRQHVPSERVLIEEWDTGDTWGEGDANDPPWNPPSRHRPGVAIGSDSIVLHSLRDSVVRKCIDSGETCRSMKVLNPIRCTFDGLQGSTFQIAGTTYENGMLDGQPEPYSTGSVLRNSTFDKATGWGIVVMGGHGVNIAWNVADFLFDGCTFRSGGYDGHGVQQYGNTRCTYRRCVFVGWNRANTFGGASPAYALELKAGSVANADFETANRFEGQLRRLLTSS